MAKEKESYPMLTIETDHYLLKLAIKNPVLAEIYEQNRERVEKIFEFHTDIALGRVSFSEGLDEAITQIYANATKEIIERMEALKKEKGYLPN